MMVEILRALQELPNVVVQKVDYNRKFPFINQLETTHNSDILMSMHGSGLTHLLFLPDWATVFEIYNCEDVYCYSDLARLRGIKYFTWENRTKIKSIGESIHPQTGKSHPKFVNYYVDVDELIRLVKQVHRVTTDDQLMMNQVVRLVLVD
ncbi:unnamed protein product [Enterobius vermicularis]|uniref:EGF domain-specific O-linked N-acetylglucosamine transferase n=1 Tax=Enterobius vermicularis TaxID=51028 RepID=A0A0N4VKS6_ENTVE|nr:unnamed protein product [Enterobius vermicularis]